jgi:hypothetical protein
MNKEPATVNRGQTPSLGKRRRKKEKKKKNSNTKLNG